MSLGLKLLQDTLQGHAHWAVLTSPVFGGWPPVTLWPSSRAPPFVLVNFDVSLITHTLPLKGALPWLEKQAS